MADKAIDDLGRDQMEFAEEVHLILEYEFLRFGEKVFVFSHFGRNLFFFFFFQSSFHFTFSMQIPSLFYIS